MFYLMVRSFGKNPPTEWVQAMIKELNPVGVILATKPGSDSHAELLDLVPPHIERILIEEPNWGFSVLIRMFGATTAHPFLPRLSLSPGAEFSQQHLEKGLVELSTYAATSWFIPQQANNGSLPGLMGYNYCMLYRPDACEVLENLPKEWIAFAENGAVGSLTLRNFDGKETTGYLGGGEETLYTVWLNRQLFTRCCHTTSNPVGQTATTGTGVSYDWKIVRKTFTALAYLQTLGIDPATYMKMWDVK
jgi:hypothetical protein